MNRSRCFILFENGSLAWNILGGYTGYVNFGSAAFFATGAYSTVFLYKALQPPLLVTSPTRVRPSSWPATCGAL